MRVRMFDSARRSDNPFAAASIICPELDRNKAPPPTEERHSSDSPHLTDVINNACTFWLTETVDPFVISPEKKGTVRWWR